ncbi:MAG: hypothetical protein QM741_10610 [Rudaea sp.]|uniref:hypothetical protein n=1 Tax=Rudaea sp. TaxID=2136325 RepID=UPI0039E3692F
MSGFLLRCFASLMICNLAFAATSAPDDAAIPAPLRDWRGWVLKDLDFRACPFLATPMSDDANGRICAWPGRLRLDADANGAAFALRWRVEAPSWVALPGDAQHWPQQVRVNGQAQPALDRDGVPALWLSAGNYDVAGTIAWRERPQSLRVPGAIGLVALSVDGNAVAPVQRDGDALTLGRGGAATAEADSVELHVFRELSDGVPATLTTRIRFAVSGQAREETLGPVLPEGFVATALVGDWPARLDDDGRLHVQVQPGAATLALDARAVAPLAAFVARIAAAPWPRQEIWSYQAAPRLRATNAVAPLSVDPQQAQVPDEWRGLPAFALGDGDKLAIEERSRGLSPDDANRLTLRREAWLDFAGGGWYAKDVVAGSMVQGWRLDVAAPFKLERADAAVADKAGEALLVTRGANEALSGVEWRTPNVDLAGSVRIDAVANLPAAGWQQTFDRIDATLHFPFGYRLLAAPGADRVEGSWMSRWTLLDVFVAAIVALLAWRLLGIVGALAATAYLALGYQESGSPLWTLVAVLALGLILRVLPAGKLQIATQWLRRTALLALALVALPFVADQVRYALYPQLEEGGGYAYYVAGDAERVVGGAPADNGTLYRHKFHRIMPAQAPAAAPPALEDEAAAMATPLPSPAPKIMEKRMDAGPQRNSAGLESVAVTGSRIAQSRLIDHYSRSTVMQTGAGEPDWSLGSTAQLGWSGPVAPAQNVRLVIAPPWLVRPLRCVLVALLAWLAWNAWRGRAQWPRASRTAAAGVAALAIAACLCAAPAARAQDLPSDELLQQLRARLTEAPKCAPACASVAQMQLSAGDDAITAVLEMHAGERLAVPLPRADAGATLKSVKVDNGVDVPVARAADGGDWIALDRGVHRVEVAYAAHADRLALNFALVPARALFEGGKGWTASGIEDDRLLGTGVNLARARAGAGAKPELGAQQFPAYVRVVRSLSLGLDWSVRMQAQRLSPASGGMTVSVPVLAGEHVSTPGIKVQNSTATVAIADGAAEAAWSGTLDKADTLTLTAPALADRAEVWRVLVSPTWHAEFSGVPGVGLDADEDANDYRNFEFHPLPGETLTVKVTRPAPVAGATRAIDAVALTSEAGQRGASHTLNFTLRASEGGEQTIALPTGADVTAVRRDGETLAQRARDGKLALPVKPGVQRYEVAFRDAAALGFAARTPAVALGLPAANVALSQQLPADRWLLATSGPAVGPAVLYWGELVVMIAVAWALARTRRTSLKFRDWLLLGLGFSTFSWIALLVVVAWLFAFDARARCATNEPWWRFDLVQVALAALTVVALVALVSAIPQGLLGAPDMHVAGNGSGAQTLTWFADRAADALPQAGAYSLPLWVYKMLMLAWALWLANALIGWLRDAWTAWTRGGYWQARPETKRVATTVAAQPGAEKA